MNRIIPRTRLAVAAKIAAAIAALTFGAGIASAAPCTGDCSADSEVTVDEIITGVNIALGSASLTTCLLFDSNGDAQVTVDEIVAAITFALSGCPAGAACGDDNVDFVQGETCDDGNTVDFDSCPADCRIATCVPGGTTREVSVSFAQPGGVELAALTLVVQYPDGVVRIPGSGNDAQVQARISGLPAEVSGTPNDQDYFLRLVSFTPDLSPIAPGAYFAITFDDCSGAASPVLGDFSCVVEDAADINFNAVSGVTCAVSF